MEEIKAGDIMIGNWFHVNGYPMYVDSIFRDTVYLEFEGNEGDVWEENIKDLKPIPLTDDILLKAGFEKNRFTKYPTFKLGKVEITNVEFFDEDSEGKEFSFKEWKLSGLYGSDLFYFKSYSPNIKHFHQLQNLFKSLTGNDLKIEV